MIRVKAEWGYVHVQHVVHACFLMLGWFYVHQYFSVFLVLVVNPVFVVEYFFVFVIRYLDVVGYMPATKRSSRLSPNDGGPHETSPHQNNMLWTTRASNGQNSLQRYPEMALVAPSWAQLNVLVPLPRIQCVLWTLSFNQICSFWSDKNLTFVEGHFQPDAFTLLNPWSIRNLNSLIVLGQALLRNN